MSELNLVPDSPYQPASPGELADRRYTLTAEKSALNAQVTAIDKEIAAIDAALHQYHAENPDVSQISGSAAKVRWSEENNYSPVAGMKETLRDWLFENGHAHLMTWHINRASADEYVNMHGPLPHVEVYVKKKVSCTKV